MRNGGNSMEFKEYGNPEEADYDIKVGIRGAGTAVSTPDNYLNTNQGVDLNDMDFEDCALTDDDRRKRLQALADEKAFYESCIKGSDSIANLEEDYTDCAKK
jgi:hypothetical protein